MIKDNISNPRQSAKTTLFAGLTALPLLFNPQASSAQERFVDARVTSNIAPGYRDIQIDCETLIPRQIVREGKTLTRLEPRVSYASQFNIERDKGEILEVKAMSEADRERYLATKTPAERQGIQKTIVLTVEQIEQMFAGAADPRPRSESQQAADMYGWQIVHNQGAHGVLPEEMRPPALACEPYHGIDRNNE